MEIEGTFCKSKAILLINTVYTKEREKNSFHLNFHCCAMDFDCLVHRFDVFLIET